MSWPMSKGPSTRASRFPRSKPRATSTPRRGRSATTHAFPFGSARASPGWVRDDRQRRAAMDVTALMRGPGVAIAVERVEAGAERILEEAVRICQIPSPTFDEGERAAYVRARYEALRLKDVAIDAAGNVRGRRPGAGTGPSVAVVTHTDTVFPRGTDLTVKRQEGRLAAPGLGDNSLSIASALGIVEALDAAGVATGGDLYFAATTGE